VCRFCHGNVDTPIGGVNTGSESLKLFMKIGSSVSTQPLDPSKCGSQNQLDQQAEESCVYRFCHGSVDTPIGGVDTGSESLKPFHEDRVKCVDTAPGSVDTSPSLQKTQFPDWSSVSTQSLVVSTLDPIFRRPTYQTGTVCRHSQ
ncbi:hypothetical protein Taro_002379, partial [Colocasia esculenta]|nr:hypothetical protein [Colocasia esculenta]